jgi:curved DNA-binding protein CbpA
MLNNRRNHYRMLYVQPDAPFEVIRANYRTLMQKLKLHPDLGGEHWNAVFVNDAYATLEDPVRRASYDLELLKHYDIATLSRGPLRVKNRPSRQAAASDHNQRNFYRILQVQPDAPLVVIEASYHALRAQGTTPAAQLEEAFTTLRDPAHREIYDRHLKQGGHLEAVARAATHPEAEPGDSTSSLQRGAHQNSGYEPLITQYCLFCKTPHYSSPSVLEEAGCRECGSPLFAPPADFLDQARRALGRSPSNEDLGFYTFWPGKRMRGRMLDLSPTGLRLLTPKVCETGDILKIDARRLQAVGVVAHQHRDGTGTTAGIKFYTVAFHHSRGSFLSTRA